MLVIPAFDAAHACNFSGLPRTDICRAGPDSEDGSSKKMVSAHPRHATLGIKYLQRYSQLAVHHLFCQECMWIWLDNGRSTCPLCRTYITAVMTSQHGLVLLQYVNDAGEEMDPQPEVEENQDESVGDNEDQQAWSTVPIVSAVLPRSENAQSGRPPSRPPRLVDGTLLSPPGRGLVAPNPTPEDTPNHSPSSRPAPASISEDSHETENPTINVWSRVDATAEANRSQTPTQPPRRQTLSIGRSPPRLGPSHPKAELGQR
jgi:hypothetical protein